MSKASESIKHIFFIGSPLQLLNAKEAAHYFGIDPSETLLIVHPGIGGLVMMKEIINDIDWPRVVILRSVAIKNLPYNLYVLNKIAEINKDCENVFVGDYRYDLMRHFLNKARPKDAILLDDGLGTLTISKEDFDVKHFAKSNNLLKEMVKKSVLQMQIGAAENISMFTAYDIGKNTKWKVHKNKYNHLRRQVKEKHGNRDIYFLGDVLVECGIVSVGVSQAYLSKIKEYFFPKKIVYVPHRRETEAKVEWIEKTFSFRIKRFNSIIEYALCIEKEFPHTLASFSSAGLINCRLIFGNKINIISFYLEPELVHESYRKNIEDVYLHLGNYLEVVRLDINAKDQVEKGEPVC